VEILKQTFNTYPEDLNVSELFLKYQVKFESPPADVCENYYWLNKRLIPPVGGLCENYKWL
jgi:hypothetical protein